MLMHPFSERLFDTMHQHFCWKNMGTDAASHVKHHACQPGKQGLKNHGEVPSKDAEQTPWFDMTVGLAAPPGKPVIIN